MKERENGEAAPADAARRRVAAARRIVVKVGTNVIMRDDGALALGRVYSLIESIATLRREGREVLVVSSGAVGLGAQKLGLPGKPRTLDLKQACAAVGQSRLMAVYEEGFEKLGLRTAQVLLTEDDFASRARYLALRATLGKLLELGVVPILNENDAVSTRELELREEGRAPVFGDNDKLSALVMSKIGADLLLILSDVDALYTGNPARDRSARRVPLVAEVTPSVVAYADGGGARGRGGMGTKLEAASIATASGGLAVIASGRSPGIVEAVLRGDDTGTVFLPRTQLTGRRRWIAYAALPAGDVFVNDGAREAIARRKASLLPAGVTRLSGDFEAGDVVVLRGEDGAEFARGIVNYGSDDAGKLVGRQSGDIDRLVSRRSYDALVTRNSIVLREPPSGTGAP